MAAPTSVTVEAQSMTTTVLRWAYSGSLFISVYRSTDGASYSNIATLIDSELEYEDTELAAGTKYWYKLSDDVGSTFSSVVTVYTHFCADQNAGKAFYLPRFDQGQDDQSSKLNDMAERVEAAVGNNTFPESCIVCPSGGAVVIDCTDACNSFVVVADTDVNSFTINRCGNKEPNITVYVPPNTTVGVCGFPPGYGFTGNECTEAPLSGGDKGRSFGIGSGGGAGGGAGGLSSPGLPKTKTGGGGSGGGVGGTGCECVPGNSNELTLKCCSDDCSLNCATTKSLRIKVCGGIGPYDFEHTGSIGFKKPDGTSEDTRTVDPSAGDNPEVTVIPPTNSGSAVAGSAYQKCHYYEGRASCGAAATLGLYGSLVYGCDDVLDSCTTTPTGCPAAGTFTQGDMECISALSGCNKPECTGDLSGPGPVGCNAGIYAMLAVDDMRTAGMITDGCAPCGLQAGSTVTVTDSTGVSVSITVGV